MASSSVYSLTRFTALASGDVIPVVDVSDATQSAHGSLDAITVTNFLASLPAPVNITSASATAFAVGLAGATNPALLVDASTASSATGLKVKSAAAAAGVAVSVVSSGANENLTLDAKGSGTITIGSVSTGAITLTRAVTLSSTLAVTGVLTADTYQMRTAGGFVWKNLGGTTIGTMDASTAALSFPFSALAIAGALSGVTTYAGSGTVTLTATGTSIAASGDISVATGKKLALNVGATSYIYESAAGVITLAVGSTQVASFFSPGGGQVGLQIYDNATGGLRTVAVGANDSGGAGYKLLRILN